MWGGVFLIRSPAQSFVDNCGSKEVFSDWNNWSETTDPVKRQQHVPTHIVVLKYNLMDSSFLFPNKPGL